VSSSSALELGAPAKLNLCLEVLGLRPDGYHEIDSVFVELDLCDRLKIELADEISIEVTGGPAPRDETNLAWRAAVALGVGAKIQIEKRIPAGGGLGGGSSDAAATLLALDELHGLELSALELHEIATSLGADVPFFLQGGTARCTGRGEVIEPVPDAPQKSFFIVIPPFQNSTAEVYGALDPGLTGNPETASFFLKEYCGGAESGSAPYFNRLQVAAERLDPRLAEVRRVAETHYGCVFTMSGSGSSYFSEATDEERTDRPDWGRNGPVRVIVAKTG